MTKDKLTNGENVAGVIVFVQDLTGTSRFNVRGSGKVHLILPAELYPSADVQCGLNGRLLSYVETHDCRLEFIEVGTDFGQMMLAAMNQFPSLDLKRFTAEIRDTFYTVMIAVTRMH